MALPFLAVALAAFIIPGIQRRLVIGGPLFFISLAGAAVCAGTAAWTM